MGKSNSINVLIVDDEKEILNMFKKWLSDKSYEVEYILNGEQALESIKKNSFDVVLLDIIMPGVPALKVLEKIKEFSSQTKVIIMSGQFVNQSQLNELEQRGADVFVQKPFSMDEIIASIQG